jgi:hypothetical protein
VQNAAILLTSATVATQVQQRTRTTADPAGQALAPVAADDLRAAIIVRRLGDIVYVRAVHGQPDVATWLANSWAQEGVVQINQSYAQTAAVDVETALTHATTDRAAAQHALEAFLAHNPIPALTQELQQTQTFVTAALASQATIDFALYNTPRATMQRNSPPPTARRRPWIRCWASWRVCAPGSTRGRMTRVPSPPIRSVWSWCSRGS